MVYDYCCDLAARLGSDVNGGAGKLLALDFVTGGLSENDLLGNLVKYLLKHELPKRVAVEALPVQLYHRQQPLPGGGRGRPNSAPYTKEPPWYSCHKVKGLPSPLDVRLQADKAAWATLCGTVVFAWSLALPRALILPIGFGVGAWDALRWADELWQVSSPQPTLFAWIICRAPIIFRSPQRAVYEGAGFG